MVRFSYKCIYFSNTLNIISQIFTYTEAAGLEKGPPLLSCVFKITEPVLLQLPEPVPEALPGESQESCLQEY